MSLKKLFATFTAAHGVRRAALRTVACYRDWRAMLREFNRPVSSDVSPLLPIIRMEIYRMLENPPIASLLLPPIAALLAALSGASFAEQAEPAMEIEEIVVTGSRIQRRNLVSASPVTQVDADELLFQGTVRVEDMVRTLPQVYSAQNTSSQRRHGHGDANLRNRSELAGACQCRACPRVRRFRCIGATLNRFPARSTQRRC